MIPTLVGLALASAACGGDDEVDGSGGGTGTGTGTGTTTGMPGCGTLEAPQTVALEGLSPALGETVPAANVTHQFTTTNLPGPLDDMVSYVFGAAHTAGTPMGSFSYQITNNQDGTFTYVSAPVSFPMAGHVEFSAQGVIDFPNGCHYAFPDPLFSYDVTP